MRPPPNSSHNLATLPPVLTGLGAETAFTATDSNKACWERAATVPLSHRKTAPSLSCGNQGLGRSRVSSKVTKIQARSISRQTWGLSVRWE